VVAVNARAELSRVPKLALVLHHRYGYCARAIDLSGHDNHGHVVRASESASAVEQSAAAGHGLRFDGVTTRVVVPPSPSLESLGAVRIDVRLLLEAGGHRRTIVEGFLAISFFVEPDGRLAGTIYTGHNWYGAYSNAPVVPTDHLVDLSFVYDGLATSILRVDGRIVAVSERPIGPVSGVAWPFGLNIGGWPDADRRMFQGVIYELKIWRARTRESGPILS
jgi:hypothetical protein